MKNECPTRIKRFRKGRQKRGRDPYQDGPADVIPFGPPAPRTPADPPTSAKVVGGRLSKRRTLTPGLSMTLVIDVDQIARVLLELEEAREKHAGERGNDGGRDAESVEGRLPISPCSDSRSGQTGARLRPSSGFSSPRHRA